MAGCPSEEKVGSPVGRSPTNVRRKSDVDIAGWGARSTIGRVASIRGRVGASTPTLLTLGNVCRSPAAAPVIAPPPVWAACHESPVT
jgi:hypothetical protein